MGKAIQHRTRKRQTRRHAALAMLGTLVTIAAGCSDTEQTVLRSGSSVIDTLRQAVLDQRLDFSGNEPHIAEDPSNPKNLAVAQFTSVSFSSDGGATFPTTVSTPVPDGYNFTFGGDPVLVFDAEGHLFFSYLATSNRSGRVDVFLQQFDHASASPVGAPVNVSEAAGAGAADGYNADKEWLAVDRFDGSPFKGRLYMVWADFSTHNVAVLTSFSADGGATWSPAQAISSAYEGFPWPPHIAVAAGGDVYLGYHVEPMGGIVLVRSLADSPTGSGGVFDLSTKMMPFPPGTANITFNIQGDGRELDGSQTWTQGSAQPYILPDPTDPAHVMIIAADDPTDVDHGPGFDDMAVFAVHSTDRGDSWSEPLQVDDHSSADTTHQLFPMGAFDLNSKCVSIAYFNSNPYLTNDNGNYLLGMVIRTSADGGMTWGPEAPVSDNYFDPDLNAPDRFPPTQTYRIGEYNGLLMSRGVVWTANDPDDDPATANQQVMFDYSDVIAPEFASVPEDIIVTTCDPTNIDLGGVARATDRCGTLPITIWNDAPDTFPFGGLVVRWFAEDGAGNVREAPQYVTVLAGEDGDATPVFTFVPENIVTEDCEGLGIGQATAVDGCGNPAFVDNDAPASYPIGKTTVTWTAHAPGGVSATATQNVICTVPLPECNTAAIQAEDMDHTVGGPVTEGWNIWSNGSISATHDFTAGTAILTVRARGEQASGAFPHMVVNVGGTPVGDVTVGSTTFADYVFTVPVPGGPASISIAFDNDYYAPPEDRNLIVDRVEVDCLPEVNSPLTAELVLYTDWGTGYCFGLWLTNDDDAPVESWQVVVNTQGTEIVDRWGVDADAATGTVTMTSLYWDSVIEPGATIQSPGFCASRPAGGNARANLVSVTPL